MRNLKPNMISFLDKIIEELDNTRSLEGDSILKICNNDPKIAESVCGILKEDGWINTADYDEIDYPDCITKSDSFRTKLASGNYADRVKFKKENSEHVNMVNHVIANNSNVVIGDNATQTLGLKSNLKKKKSLFGIILLIIGAVAGIFTILTYFK